MSEWRTATVVALCENYRQTRELGVLPILADALEEAGYADTGQLAAMRGRPREIEAERIVAIIYSNETAAAVADIEYIARELGPRAFVEEGDGYGDRCPVTYERLMSIGYRWVEDDPEGWGGYTTEHGSEDLRDGGFAQYLESFWAAFRAITGKKGEDNPFSCTC